MDSNGSHTQQQPLEEQKIEPWMAMEAMLNDPLAEDDSVVVRRVFSETETSSSSTSSVLNLAMLSCENQPPYGPPSHTAQLFGDLLVQAAQQQQQQQEARQSHTSSSSGNDSTTVLVPHTIRIQIYDAKAASYPDDWDRFDGILLPGSFSSAYDSDAWIEKLKEIIQEKIVAKQRPTLAICFGHQILAHSFAGQGKCIKTPSGPRAGRYTTTLTEEGQRLLGGGTELLGNDNKTKPQIQLYYTHNDMVSQLPATAVSLGTSSEGDLPVLAAAYYESGRGIDSDTNKKQQQQLRPYAVSFQAHPEYATSLDLGLYRTLNLCCAAMEQQHPHLVEWKDNATPAHFPTVQQDSVDATMAVARLLGWFPESEDTTNQN